MHYGLHYYDCRDYMVITYVLLSMAAGIRLSVGTRMESAGMFTVLMALTDSVGDFYWDLLLLVHLLRRAQFRVLSLGVSFHPPPEFVRMSGPPLGHCRCLSTSTRWVLACRGGHCWSTW